VNIVLDPRLKLAYAIEHKWEAKWIKEARYDYGFVFPFLMKLVHNKSILFVNFDYRDGFLKLFAEKYHIHEPNRLEMEVPEASGSAIQGHIFKHRKISHNSVSYR
jgi:hypothetical protein